MVPTTTVAPEPGDAVAPADETRPTPNTAELVAIYQYIKAHREEWDQSFWAQKTACGTAYCFAGFAIARAGAEPDWDRSYYVPRTDFCTLSNGETRLIDGYAQDLLGLDSKQADDLFYAGNSLDDIREMIEAITGVDPESAPVVSQ